MAACDQGYPCQTCGEPVKNIIDSSLYVRYVLGEVQPHELFTAPDRHLACDTVLSQFIQHEKFTPVTHVGSDDKHLLSPEERLQKEERVTAAWLRLREVHQKKIPITQYPFPTS